MTHRERVNATLRHRQPDRCPCAMGLTQKAHAAMVEYCGNDDYLKRIDNSIYGVAAKPGPKNHWVSDTVWQDEFGVQWDRSIDRDIGNVCNCVISERDLDNVELPDTASPDKFEGFVEAVEEGRRQQKFLQFSIGFSLFERAWTLRGMENLFYDMVEAPTFAEELFDAICDYNVSLVKKALQYDIDAVHFGDDWGSQRGLLMSPKSWERFIKPRLARMYGAAKEAGKFVTIHSCGKVQELFPQLVDLGLDCFNPFQPEVMDPYEMKQQHGDRLSFWGGVSTQQLLPYGTPEEVRAEVRRLIKEVGRDGGYILAPAHGIPGDAKPENIMALIEVANE